MRFIFFFICTSIIQSSSAQITLTRADFPKPTATSPLPDSVEFTTVSNFNTQSSQSINGANVSWNESGLTGTTSFQNFVPMSSTPLVFQLVFISCDYAVPLLAGNNIAGNPLADAYEYYNYSSNSNRLEIKGFGGNLTIPPSTVGIPIPAIYSSPDVLYRFPLNYGDVDTSNSAFDIKIPFGLDSARIKRQQTRINNVDAWGSVTTPFGTFNVLRVASEIQRIDSLLYPPIITLGLPSNTIEYKWISNGNKIPVLQINGTTATGNFTPTGASFLGKAAVPDGLQSLDFTNKVKIYPNPVSDICNLSFTLNNTQNVDVSILSIKGEKVGDFHFKNLQSGNHTQYLPLQSLSSGTYFLKLSSKEMNFTKVLAVK